MMLDHCDDSLSLLDARAKYFAANKLGPNGGYDAKWVDVKIGPVSVRIPNTHSRVRAVRFHDLHHVLTAYRTTFTGECEIGAWEVASGCAAYWAAWFLNLAAFGSGLLFAPGHIWRAFLRGRRSSNLYRAKFDDALLARRVGDMRRELRLTDLPPVSALHDRITFLAWSIAALVLLGAQIVIGTLMLPAIAIVSRLRISNDSNHQPGTNSMPRI